MAQEFEITRRNFVVGAAAAGTGFCLGFYSPFGAETLAADTVPEVNAWVVIKPDDTVVIRIARSEMGQGTLTGLAQLVAEELECDWANVTTEYPTPAQSLARGRVWGSFSTGGSRGIRTSHEYVRKGGAAAREMLVAAAAKRWKVAPSECRTAAGVITHTASGRSLSYGAVASEAAKLEPPFDVFLKDPKDWKIAGRSVPRLDTADKVTGKQVYGTDLWLPGTLNASIKACPVFGGTVKSFDAAKVSGLPGVRKVVRVGDNAVAVVADTWWRAHKALQALPVIWDFGPNANVTSASIDAMLKEGLDAREAFIGNKAGDIVRALAGAAKKVDADYGYPYKAHATMEPMNATALWTPDKCEVWCPTQNGESALEATAKAAGLPNSKCDVYKIHLGGGFGRRGAFNDYIEQAVAIARQMPGTPIKLIWSREEDMTHDHYHPITRARFTGALDKDGNLAGLRVRISGQSILAGVMPSRLQDGMDLFVFQGLAPDGDHAFSYDVPNLLIDHAMRNPHVPPGFWRGVNINQNALYLESFVDELARAAGQDPLAFRQKMLSKNPKGLAVLNAVAERAGWAKPTGKGVGRGLALCKTFGSYVAACAEVSVGERGDLKIHRIIAATDPGHAVNPRQIEMQVEGSFVYGLSALLYGACTVRDGRIEQQNFDSYQVLRMAQMPEVETIVMPSGGFWGGVGEPTIAVAAPAVLNAIHAATGKRIRQVPIGNVDLRKS
jgi:isoquinoline 1-oxidoreductase subunit beta